MEIYTVSTIEIYASVASLIQSQVYQTEEMAKSQVYYPIEEMAKASYRVWI